MKLLQSIFGILIISFAFAVAQSYPDFTVHPQIATDNIQYNSAANDYFYENNNGIMQMMISPEFMGPTFSYFTRSDNRLQYGFNAGLIPVATDNELVRDYYRANNQSRLLLVPFWFSLKIRLRTQQDEQIIPYLITGLGPTLGLDLGTSNGFINTINYMRGELGGGGYLGLGFDYLWAEEWAISADARYNVFVFDQPIGEDKEFEGFSFFIGFTRAFGL